MDNEGGVIFESVTFVLDVVYAVIVVVFCAEIRKRSKGLVGEVSLESSSGNRRRKVNTMVGSGGDVDVSSSNNNISKRNNYKHSSSNDYDDDNNNVNEEDEDEFGMRGVSFDYSNRNASIDFTRGTSIDVQRGPIISNNDDD